MRFVAVAAVAIACIPIASAQERTIELSLYGGGYFNAGYQTYERLVLGGISLTGQTSTVQVSQGTSREFRPVIEPHSGIFGGRASYDVNSRFSVEGSFGFSPAAPSGPSIGVYSFVSISDFLSGSSYVPSSQIAVRGGDTFHYAGNVLFHWDKNDWTPFVTGGLGAVRRTADIVMSSIPSTAGPGFVFVPGPNPLPDSGQIAPLIITIPSPAQVDFSVNFGGGVKKYFSERYGVRFDLRDYISAPGGDTVNNFEVSLGLIFRL